MPSSFRVSLPGRWCQVKDAEGNLRKGVRAVRSSDGVEGVLSLFQQYRFFEGIEAFRDDEYVERAQDILLELHLRTDASFYGTPLLFETTMIIAATCVSWDKIQTVIQNMYPSLPRNVNVNERRHVTVYANEPVV